MPLKTVKAMRDGEEFEVLLEDGLTQRIKLMNKRTGRSHWVSARNFSANYRGPRYSQDEERRSTRDAQMRDKYKGPRNRRDIYTEGEELHGTRSKPWPWQRGSREGKAMESKTSHKDSVVNQLKRNHAPPGRFIDRQGRSHRIVNVRDGLVVLERDRGDGTYAKPFAATVDNLVRDMSYTPATAGKVGPVKSQVALGPKDDLFDIVEASTTPHDLVKEMGFSDKDINGLKRRATVLKSQGIDLEDHMDYDLINDHRESVLDAGDFISKAHRKGYHVYSTTTEHQGRVGEMGHLIMSKNPIAGRKEIKTLRDFEW